MIKDDINEITENDLLALVNNKVPEKKILDYKQALPGRSDSERVEFLADVTSFANTIGGHLYYGIVEDRTRGVPERLEGMTVENINQEILALEDILRNGVRPRIMQSSISFRPVLLSNSKWALVIRIRQSWGRPHRVVLHGHDKFYARSTKGKYQMDVDELRVAFNLSETIADRIRKFKEERISKIYADETPQPICRTAKVVLHIVPFNSFDPAQTYDLQKIYSDYKKIGPLGYGGYSPRINIDGILTYSQDREGKSYAYTQLFRNGIIEAVDCLPLEPQREEQLIPSESLARELIENLAIYLSTLEELGVGLPIFIFLTLVNARGYRMGASHETRSMIDRDYPIDRDLLQLPEVKVESFNEPADDVLKPCFDALWNACGYPRSFNYDSEGNWTGRQFKTLLRGYKKK